MGRLKRKAQEAVVEINAEITLSKGRLGALTARAKEIQLQVETVVARRHAALFQADPSSHTWALPLPDAVGSVPAPAVSPPHVRRLTVAASIEYIREEARWDALRAREQALSSDGAGPTPAGRRLLLGLDSFFHICCSGRVT